MAETKNQGHTHTWFWNDFPPIIRPLAAHNFRLKLVTILQIIQNQKILTNYANSQAKRTNIIANTVGTKITTATLIAMEAVSLKELMKVREIVESGAAKMAAEQADKENIRRLLEISDLMQLSQDSSEAYYENDFKFHLGVAGAANNQALFQIVKFLVDKTHQHISFMNEALDISMPSNVKKCVGSAQKVIRFIEAGDGPRAEAAMKEHLNTVSHKLRKEFSGKQSLPRMNTKPRMNTNEH